MTQRISDSNHGSRVLHIIGVECNFTVTCRTNNILRDFSMIRKGEKAEKEMQRIEIDKLTQIFHSLNKSGESEEFACPLQLHFLPVYLEIRKEWASRKSM